MEVPLTTHTKSNDTPLPTRLAESFQPWSLVVVVDATRPFMPAALLYTLDNLVRPGDNLHLLGILYPMSMRYDISRKYTEFRRCIGDQTVKNLIDSNKIVSDVHIAIGPDRKVTTAKQAVEFRATWVILDACLTKDKAYLIEQLNCNIVLMGRNEAKFIKIKLPNSVNNPGVLEWKARWQTAVGTARALRYLHEECHVSCTVHRDMRPYNVLLTDHMFSTAVGEDFGPSRSKPAGEQPEEESKTIGNIGYLAPESAESGSKFSEEADVYSFGVLLLELISGLKANDIKTRAMSLTEWAIPLIQSGKTLEIVDPHLRDFCDLTQVSKLTDVVRRCICEDPANRPSMTKVVHILERRTMDTDLMVSRSSSSTTMNSLIDIPKEEIRNPTRAITHFALPQRKVFATGLICPTGQHIESNGTLSSRRPKSRLSYSDMLS